MMGGWSEELMDLYRFAWTFGLITWPLVWFASLSSYKHVLGPEVSAVWTRRWRVWLAVASFIVGAFLIAFRLDTVVPNGMSLQRAMQSRMLMERAAEQPMDVALIVGQLWCAGLVPVLGGALGVKLYEKWLNGRTSEAERQRGAAGVRAWLNGANVVLILGIAICARVSEYGNLSLVALLLMTAAVVLAYPMVTTMTSADAVSGTAAVVAADLTPERERVLRMLEEGKVTAEEAAELLSALGHTIPVSPTVVEPWTPGRKLMMAGAAAVLVGFFLPWFSFNPGAEVRRMMGQMTTSMGMDVRAIPGTDMVETPGATVRIAGGDIGHGLGWIMLALALAAAATPFVATGLAREQRRVVMLVALAAGGIVGLYLLTGNLSRVEFGLPIVLVGYAVEAFGVVRDRIVWNGAPAFATRAQVV
jgi:hypothetical protein